MKILSIDTSCDETSVAMTDDRRILSNRIYSQILIHKKWGGVVPNLARRAHEERIDEVIIEAMKRIFGSDRNLCRGELASRHSVRSVHSSLKRTKYAFARHSLAQTSTPSTNFIANYFSNIDHIAVTYGPGLAPALEVGVRKAIELAKKYGKKIIPVDHMEGHIYSCFAQNSAGNPARPFEFPYLALLISGGHTQLVRFTNHIEYEIIGTTIDDAVGEALDKAAKMFGLGYPGGPVIERMAKDGDPYYHQFTIPMKKSGNCNFSYSGLKTALLYYLKSKEKVMKKEELQNIAASFQHAAFLHLIDKLGRAINETNIKNILVAGGVAANNELRRQVRAFIKARGGSVLFPVSKMLCGDNAAMIGVAAYYKARKNIFVKDLTDFDRVPRAQLD